MENTSCRVYACLLIDNSLGFMGIPSIIFGTSSRSNIFILPARSNFAHRKFLLLSGIAGTLFGL